MVASPLESLQAWDLLKPQPHAAFPNFFTFPLYLQPKLCPAQISKFNNAVNPIRQSKMSDDDSVDHLVFVATTLFLV